MDIQQHWPDEPYRELDFYTTADEALFCERSADVDECMQLFSQYHTKVLLLHGSSGSGKSSFLRAGLIPQLKRVTDPPGYAFLPHQDGVIRCSDDPVRSIATHVLAAVERAGTDTVRQSRPVRQLLESAPLLSGDVLAGTSSGDLVEPLLNTLSLLRLLVGKTVVLVVDQAEEILTHPGSNGCTEAFFRLIEEIYLRDFDVRLIISLRTEYYGRFRNHLQIRDRYRALPTDGGLELYLLNLLRDPEVLTHALDWPASNGRHEYGFRFAPGALRKIVEDVLGHLPPNAAVTPVLQVVCATLTAQRNPNHPVVVTAERYRALGGYGQIMDRFINSAITGAAVRRPHPLRSVLAAIGIGDSLTDRWRSVLMRMVSEQGGGVVVAIPGSEADLERVARGHGLKDRIGPALCSMASGRGAILRVMGTDASPAYILKHDSLALRLWRWNQQQAVVRRARRKAVYATVAGVVIGGAVGIAFLVASFSSLSAHDANIRLRNNFALHEPGGHAERSLMVLLADLKETTGYYDTADRIRPSHVHRDTLDAMRRTLLRSPWLHERVAAAGMSSDGTELALLDGGRDTVRVLTFPDGAAADTPGYRSATLRLSRDDPGTPPRPRPRGLTFSPTAVGFVTGLDVTVIREGQVFYWGNGEATAHPLAPMLPDFGDNPRLRYEIVGGAIQVTQRNQHDGVLTFRTARLDDAALRRGVPVPASPPFDLPALPFQQPGPLFDNATGSGRYLLSQSPDGDRLPEDEAGQHGREQLCALDLSLRRADGSEAVRFPAMKLHIKQQEANRPQVTMAFPAGDANAVAFKSSGASFYLRDFSSAPGEVGLPDGSARRIVAAGAAVGGEDDNTLLPAQWPLIHPLFAVARTEHGWRAAWMTGNGVQAVETDADFDRDPGQDGRAHEILSDVLIGEPVGVRLAFSRGGRFLVLEQNLPDWKLVDVKVWDLGSAWQRMIESPDTDEAKLTQLACHAIGKPTSSGADQLKLFDIAPQFARPCDGVK